MGLGQPGDVPAPLLLCPSPILHPAASSPMGTHHVGMAGCHRPLCHCCASVSPGVCGAWMWLFRATAGADPCRSPGTTPRAPPAVSQPSPLGATSVTHQEYPCFGVMPHTRVSLAPMPIWKLAAVHGVRLPRTSVSPLTGRRSQPCW